jgi:hypothetical protein
LRVIAGFCGNVVAAILFLPDTNNDKVSVGYWPNALVFHMDNLEFSCLVNVDNFKFDQRFIDFLGDIGVFKKLHNFLIRKLNDRYSFDC